MVQLSNRFPQLLLPISRGMAESEIYKDAVLRGKRPDRKPRFSLSEADTLEICASPVGPVEVLTLYERADFEHCVQALAYKCEPEVIPASIGAETISGLIDWGKILQHKSLYFLSGGKDWNAEFAAFTSERKNYTSTLIILSRGYYSNLRPEKVDMQEAEWLEKSQTIRKYHELMHVVSRKMYPNDISAIRDEVIADMAGLAAAFGRYDTHLAELFLGIEDGKLHEDSRLLHYLSPGEEPQRAVTEAELWIADTAKVVSEYGGTSSLQTLPAILEKLLK